MKYFKFLYLLLFLNFSTAFAEVNNEILKEIRLFLPQLKDSPTGAIDADGNYTKDRIQGLNCAGFAKWVVDGFYYPLARNETEKYISLRNLRKKHLTERGTQDILVYENSRDPYFGLDWTRNLAVELGKKRGENPSYKTYDINDSAIDEYVTDRGYRLDKIESILIEQSSFNSNRIYLGSINGIYGKNPKLWQHYHVVVFVSYFDNGNLKIAVLERNKETSFSYLQKRYSNTYCHLVAISTDGDFELTLP